MIYIDTSFDTNIILHINHVNSFFAYIYFYNIKTKNKKNINTKFPFMRILEYFFYSNKNK
ncbi:hypothetical protein PFAG_04945 [Plasmodium falciparum Santa Lucia]|uniref:Uncharacterized protein n=2 Tax=Plasmodium falciparum TaxID=5833 RepID=A0A024X2G8_PLAFC|nr:hypothetical protein PFMC_04834 [Plasmodium falciparum CAMP/Malaysia]EUT80304.1 hypothetical protein PFAG_04945 [Plasmodium falciparum Santa Lucia]